MEVLVFASRKGGSGKSTLTAHLAAHAHKPTRPCLLIDADPQGSLALWHKLREAGGEADEVALKSVQRGIADVVKAAKRDGIDWVFIDTAPNMSASVTDAIRTATLVVIPCRPGVFDLDAVKETIEFAQRRRASPTPWCSMPHRQSGRTSNSPWSRRRGKRWPSCKIPVWGGQITQRANFSAGPGRRGGRQRVRFRLLGGGRNRRDCGSPSRSR